MYLQLLQVMTSVDLKTDNDDFCIYFDQSKWSVLVEEEWWASVEWKLIYTYKIYIIIWKLLSIDYDLGDQRLQSAIIFSSKEETYLLTHMKCIPLLIAKRNESEPQQLLMEIIVFFCNHFCIA